MIFDFNIESIITYGFIVIALLIIAFVVIAFLRRKKYLKETTEHACQYLDSFYYTVITPNNSNLITYHVVKDLSDSKIYAIPSTSFKNCNIIHSKGKFEVTYGNDKHKCVEGTKVLASINKEMNDCFTRDGNHVVIKRLIGRQKVEYTNEQDSCSYSNITIPKLYNVNKKYDVSLLDNAIFADGIAEFEENTINK